MKFLVTALAATCLLAYSPKANAQTFTFYGPATCMGCMGTTVNSVTVAAGDFVGIFTLSGYLTPGSLHITDTLSNTWKTSYAAPNWSGGNGTLGALLTFGCSGITTPGTDSVSATNGGGPDTSFTLVVIVAHNFNAPCTFTTDAFDSTQGSAANPSQTMTLSSSTDIVFSAFSSDAATMSIYGGSMTQLGSSTSPYQQIWGAQKYPSSGSYTVTTSGGTSGNYAFLTLAFGSSPGSGVKRIKGSIY